MPVAVEVALDPDPLAWTSPDGFAWTPEEMPATGEIEDAQRVVRLEGGRLLVVGRTARQHAAWVRDPGPRDGPDDLLLVGDCGSGGRVWTDAVTSDAADSN